ncbi:hypothetical protein VISI1226_10712 [Vibrio sinaloensis DSM 21326]|uniref:Aspartate-semialdehyde dehydrogenase n=1 Tax=Vibrio sinaloensis DSM 21326 TaxID=945550 RepID=E8MAW4_PHOS4|nr:hypothetical protein [Vibrio sinaloensis]EGA68794.1 hypothetical protein VISI1226_10712 [Vibrio sinaloensis DSM 21326]
MSPVSKVTEQIYLKSKAENFAGEDPFDGLNSKVFDFFPFLKNGLFGLAWTQFFKRSRLNFRPFFGVPKKRNPKGIALFILGLIQEFKLKGTNHSIEEAVALADWLIDNQCEKKMWNHSCWGYHFDWKARAFFVPKGKPNVISTIYVAQALYQLSGLLEGLDFEKAEKYKEAAFNSADFIVETLYTKDEKNEFFAYIPGEKAFVHNASLWAAAWVSVVAAEKNNKKYAELAIKVARQSVDAQNNDGSWVYGTRSHHQFIDGFHTGYNLEALNLIRESLGISEFDSSISSGYEFYKQNLFEADGTAKYYHNNKYPLDPHSVSQAIITISKLGESLTDKELLENVINKAISELYLEVKGQFVYQKTKSHTNSINYMRWTQAWMYYSLSLYSLNRENDE